MIHRISRSVVNLYIRKGAVTEEYRDAYQYGVELILSTILDDLLVLGIGFLIHRWIESILFLAIISTVRIYTGGYHANSYLGCTVATVCNYLVCVLLQYLTGQLFWAIPFGVFGLFALAVIIKWAPVEHENRPLEEGEYPKYRRLAIGLSVSLTMAALILAVIGVSQAVFVEIVLFMIAVNILIALILKGEKKP